MKRFYILPIFAALACVLTLAAGEEAALEKAVQKYLVEVKHLDMKAMSLKFDAVEVKGDAASANVAYYLEGGETPIMLYRYTFERKGGAWSVLESTPLSGVGGAPTHGGEATPHAGALEDGTKPPLDATHMGMLQKMTPSELPAPEALPARGNYPSWLGILVMLNNFFHDLAVAMFFCAWMALVALARRPVQVEELERLFRRVAGWSFGFIFAFGVVRVLAYKDFEWYPAAEKGQVAALAVKHCLFVIIIIWGWLHLRKAKKARMA